MKKMMIVATFAALVVLTGCKKAEQTAETTVDTVKIAADISKAVCSKMEACGKACPDDMEASLSSALPEKAKTISANELTTCVSAISASDCTKLDSDSAPQGCEFMN